MNPLKFLSGSSVKDIGDAIDKTFTSDEERLDAKIKMEKLRNTLRTNQHEINKIEAGHRSLFVAGWRPAIGWICVLGLANAFFIAPALTLFNLPLLPIPTDIVMELVIALLGLSGLRTYEKTKGVTS